MQVYLNLMVCNMNLKEVIYLQTFLFYHILMTIDKLNHESKI